MCPNIHTCERVPIPISQDRIYGEDYFRRRRLTHLLIVIKRNINNSILFVCVMHALCMCLCECRHVGMHAYACGGQKSISGIFLYQC